VGDDRRAPAAAVSNLTPPAPLPSEGRGEPVQAAPGVIPLRFREGGQGGVGPLWIVEARGLRKSYHRGAMRVPALRGVDFAVRRGEMVAIMGPSGCGKTTLLNCLAGLDTIDGGDVRVEGTSLRAMSDDARATYRARRMGFVFQAYNLLPVLSAVENVELPLLLAGESERTARRRAQAALAEVGLTHRATHRPAELSGGQQQRVAIARALVTRPAIVWADEPTGNLDSEAAAEILDLMGRLNCELEQTLVVVTHAPEVAGRAHRRITMRDGQIVNDGEQQSG
jgi:putative ABC transport system ATP-binding protein